MGVVYVGEGVRGEWGRGWGWCESGGCGGGVSGGGCVGGCKWGRVCGGVSVPSVASSAEYSRLTNKKIPSVCWLHNWLILFIAVCFDIGMAFSRH